MTTTVCQRRETKRGMKERYGLHSISRLDNEACMFHYASGLNSPCQGDPSGNAPPRQQTWLASPCWVSCPPPLPVPAGTAAARRAAPRRTRRPMPIKVLGGGTAPRRWSAGMPCWYFGVLIVEVYVLGTLPYDRFGWLRGHEWKWKSPLQYLPGLLKKKSTRTKLAVKWLLKNNSGTKLLSKNLYRKE